MARIRGMFVAHNQTYCFYIAIIVIHILFIISSVESQKGVNVVQWCSIENQKGIIAIDFVQQ